MPRGINRAGQMADRAGSELHVERQSTPANRAPRRFRHEALHALNVAAEKAHDINGMRMQRADVLPRRRLVGIIDPQRHVNEKRFAQLAISLQLLQSFGGGREAMVQIDAEEYCLLL